MAVSTSAKKPAAGARPGRAGDAPAARAAIDARKRQALLGSGYPRVAKPLELQIATEVDQEFQSTGDVVRAIEGVALLLDRGVAVPPALALWLCRGMLDWLEGKASSLDAALGITDRGKADPRRRRREATRHADAMFRMQILHMLGATIKEATTIVRLLDSSVAQSFTWDTLFQAYSRSGLGSEAKAARAKGPSTSIERSRWAAWAAEYVRPLPDSDPELQRAKARILALCAKHGVLMA